MDITLIQGTMTGLKAAADIAKSLHELKSLAEIQSKVIDLQSAILSAQSSALAANAEQSVMLEQLRQLNDEINRLKKWEEERTRYSLVSPWSSALVYALKQECSNSEPPHLLCTNCYENGKKSILQPKNGKDCALLYCPACKAELHARTIALRKPEYAQAYSA